MLVLSRKRDESVLIGGPCKVTVVEIRGDKVRLGFHAPRDVPVHRQEIWVDIYGSEELTAAAGSLPAV